MAAAIDGLITLECSANTELIVSPGPDSRRRCRRRGQYYPISGPRLGRGYQLAQNKTAVLSRRNCRAHESHRARVTQTAGKWLVTQQRWEPWVASSHGRDNQAYGRRPALALARQLLPTLPRQMSDFTRAGLWVRSAHGRQIGQMDAPPTCGLRRGKNVERVGLNVLRQTQLQLCFALTSRREETGLSQSKAIMASWWISGQCTTQYGGKGIRA